MTLRLAVVSPHPDDAALSLAGTLARLLKARLKVVLVCCFSRSGWAPRLPGYPTAARVTRVRSLEEQAYVRSLGAGASSVVIGLRDAPLRRRRSVFAPPVRADIDQARTLANALAQVPVDAALVPLGLGHHVDHSIARAAGLAAFAGQRLAFYEDVPYSLGLRAQALAGAAARAQQLVGQPLRSLSVRVAPVVRERAIACYPSQFTPAEARRFARARHHERLWTTRAMADLLRRRLRGWVRIHRVDANLPDSSRTPPSARARRAGHS